MTIRPAITYDLRNEQEYRNETETILANCHKKNQDFILRSPNNAPWTVSVSNSGYLTVNGVAHSASNKVLLWLSM